MTPPATQAKAKLNAEELRAWYGANQVLHDIDVEFEENTVTALIGPSGSGKTTLLRCLNRMHEMLPGARVEGDVLLDGVSIYGSASNTARLRQRVGMVFQKAAPFPTMSIRENVVAGRRLTGIHTPDSESDVIEQALSQAALWEDARDILDRPGTSLSEGQKQRLCIARALAVEPEVLLLDEPCASLDPMATARIEDLLRELSNSYTIVIVTHNMQQATRVSDHTAFFIDGNLVEYAPTDNLFTSPRDPRTEDYITGKFG